MTLPTDIPESKVLYIIACASRVAGRIDGLITSAQQAGWDVCVVATPKGMNFIDRPLLEKLTNRPVRNDYKRPEEPDIFPFADALVAFPTTLIPSISGREGSAIPWH